MFNREGEISLLEEKIQKKISLNVIIGYRRVGKTSLLQTVLENVENKIIIDLRELAPKTSISKSEIIGKFQTVITSFLSETTTNKEKLKSAFLSIRGVSAMGYGVQFESSGSNDVDLAGVFNELNKWAKDNGTVVIALDEAQHFNKVQDFSMADILAHLYDYCKNIVVILTGSEIGLLYNFLGQKRVHDTRTKKEADEFSNHALAGRVLDYIELKPFSSEDSKKFLQEGFTQLNRGFEKSDGFTDFINLAVEKLDGIVGWLVMLGIKCESNNAISEEYVAAAQKDGSDVAYGEFVHFLDNRKASSQYSNILKILAKGPENWSEIKKQLEKKENKKIYDANFSNLLETLVDYSFIDHNSDDKSYFIPDPLLVYKFN